VTILHREPVPLFNPRTERWNHSPGSDATRVEGQLPLVEPRSSPFGMNRPMIVVAPRGHADAGGRRHPPDEAGFRSPCPVPALSCERCPQRATLLPSLERPFSGYRAERLRRGVSTPKSPPDHRQHPRLTAANRTASDSLTAAKGSTLHRTIPIPVRPDVLSLRPWFPRTATAHLERGLFARTQKLSLLRAAATSGKLR
jgi:hypothetical protein